MSEELLTCDDLATTALLVVYEVAAAVVPVEVWLVVLERLLTLSVLFQSSDPRIFQFFTTHSFNTSVFSSKLLLRNPQLFYLLPLAFAIIAPYSWRVRWCTLPKLWSSFFDRMSSKE